MLCVPKIKIFNNKLEWIGFIAPLFLLMVEIIIITICISIGMIYDLKDKQFAVWHRNAAGYIFKTFFITICMLLGLISGYSILNNADIRNTEFLSILRKKGFNWSGFIAFFILFIVGTIKVFFKILHWCKKGIYMENEIKNDMDFTEFMWSFTNSNFAFENIFLRNFHNFDQYFIFPFIHYFSTNNLSKIYLCQITQ